MEIRGKKPLAIPTEAQEAPQETIEQAGVKPSQIPEVVQSGSGGLADQVVLTPGHTAKPPAEVTPGEGLKCVLAIKSSEDLAIDDNFRAQVQAQITALGASDLSVEGQQKFVSAIDKMLRMPDDAPRLNWIRNATWELIRGEKGDVEVLRRYFRAKGMKLLPGDVLPEGNPGFQLQRSTFRAELRKLEGSGVITRRDALSLLDSLKNNSNLDDLAWCRKEIQKRLRTGRLRFADRKTEKLIEAFFANRAPGQIAQEEVGLELHWLRRSGFSDDNFKHVCDLLEGCEVDRTLFRAQRDLDREVKKALAQPESLTDEQRNRLEQMQRDLNAFFEQKLSGRFDAYAEEKKAEKLLRKGRIDRPTFLAMKAAAVTSTSYEEYAHGVMCAELQLRLIETQAQLLETWSEVCKAITDNLSDDLRDASGRIIETRQERELKQRREERRKRRLTFEPAKIKELATRAWLSSSKQNLLSALAGEKDAARRADLQGAVAASDNRLADVEAPQEPQR